MYLTQTLHNAKQQADEQVLTVCGQRVRTVRESYERVARLAAGLRSVGVRDAECVGVLALNSDRYHELLLAIPWSGAVLNLVNVRWSPAEIAYSLRDSRADVLVVDDAFAPMVPHLRALHPSLRTVIHCGEATPRASVAARGDFEVYEELIARNEPLDDARRGGSATLGVFYTGGTTGQPKGVVLSHDNVMLSTMGAQASGLFVTPGAVLLHAAPLFHMAGMAVWNSGMLVRSIHVFLPAFEPAAVLRAIDQHKITDLLLVPSMIQMLVASPARGEHDLSSVRKIIYGASPIQDALLAGARELFPNAAFTQAYGMTELGPVATLLAPEDHDDPRLRRSAGRAAPHTEVRIVDTAGQEVPRGTVGEIIVRGDGVMTGYLNQPEETRRALKGGWMHTGDGGYMDECGYVYMTDRIKDMIISGGENVYPTEVENALTHHPAVAQCAVIGLPDEQWGERVHAVVVLHTGHTATEHDLRDSCRTHIAAYKLPRSFTFTDTLPISVAGKILKHQLRTHLAAQHTRSRTM